MYFPYVLWPIPSLDTTINLQNSLFIFRILNVSIFPPKFRQFCFNHIHTENDQINTMVNEVNMASKIQ